MTVCRPAVVATACRADVQTVSATHGSDMARHESPYTMASTPDLAAESKSTTLACAVPVMKASLVHSVQWSSVKMWAETNARCATAEPHCMLCATQ